MKAPEKLYLRKRNKLPLEVVRDEWYETENQSIYGSIYGFVEYTRTDAVIENLDEQMIAKYLYEKKGYPIDLNGNIPSFEETMKDVEKYNNYKKDKFIKKACDKLKQLMYDQHLFEGRMHQDAIIENFVGYFKDYIKGE